MNLIGQLKNRTNFLTTKETMELLQLRRNTVCDWVQSGQLPAIRTGGGYRFDPAALAHSLELRSTGGGA
jgi:excisionase family DNA binding protein